MCNQLSLFPVYDNKINGKNTSHSYGIPYKGSKNIYAKKICEALPSGKRLVDLFAGGCAVTDCALRNYPHKWDSFLVNDISHEPIDLFYSCLCGKRPVSTDWVTRAEFESADYATRLVWSFGDDTKSYLFGRYMEDLEYDKHRYVVDGCIDGLVKRFGVTPENLPTIQARRIYFRKYYAPMVYDGLYKDLMSRDAFIKCNQIERIERLEGIYNPYFADVVQVQYNSYESYKYEDGDIVYCDIPYHNTKCTQYKNKWFNHEAFWQWAKQRPYDVYVSERTIPDDAEIILTYNAPNRANKFGCDGHKLEYLVRV